MSKEEEAIDPLEQVKPSLATPPITPLQQKRVTYKLKLGEEEEEKREKGKTTHFKNEDGLSLEQKLLFLEAQLLRSLPYSILASFLNICTQLVPRVSLIALAIHVMILVPALKYVKFELHLSIANYFYLGPVVLAVPLIFFFLWESELVPLPFIDRKLVDFIYVEKQAAKRQLAKDEERFLMILESEYEEDLATQLALARLVSRIDEEALAMEVLGIKKRKQGLNAAFSSFDIGSSSERERQKQNQLSRVPISLLEAAKMLVADYSSTSEQVGGKKRSDEEVLRDLKLLQKQLEKKE